MNRRLVPKVNISIQLWKIEPDYRMDPSEQRLEMLLALEGRKLEDAITKKAKAILDEWAAARENDQSDHTIVCQKGTIYDL